MSHTASLALVVLRIAILFLLLPHAVDWRSPGLASARSWALAVLIALPLGLIVAEIWTLRRSFSAPRMIRAMSGMVLALAWLCLISVLALETRFHWVRHQVMHADAAQLERLGRHLIVGYRNAAELKALIDRRAIAGVFLATRNVEGNDVAAIKRSIAALQDIRRRQGLPALLVATDQEGGGVSRLSPPLTRLPPISEVVAAQTDSGRRRKAVANYAATQGRELADLGVNLNFAPVVDLKPGVVNANDRMTRIAERAISNDPRIVIEVAETYCAALLETGVRCTLKHFPGLGRVFEDTHQGGAELASPAAELAVTDWLPFRALMQQDNVLVMLSHVRLTRIDSAHPVSFSRAVIAGLLRRDWNHDGVLITDDFTMGAVDQSPEGIAGASIEALNAGADLILVSFDIEQYYVIMHALMVADREGRLRQDMLQQSDRRLDRLLGR